MNSLSYADLKALKKSLETEIYRVDVPNDHWIIGTPESHESRRARKDILEKKKAKVNKDLARIENNYFKNTKG